MTSYRFALNPRSRKAGRFIAHVRTEIQKALVEEKKQRGLTQAKIAELLGVHRSVINREVTGRANLTLRRVAELAWALDRDIVFNLVPHSARKGCNEPRQMPPETISEHGSDIPWKLVIRKKPESSRVETIAPSWEILG